MRSAKVVDGQSAFEAAADQESYRVAESELASCGSHGSAAVLCSNAGKAGRNGRSAAVGATLFWLTCPCINSMIARLERHGAVSALQRLVDEDDCVAAQHVASHTLYEARARFLLSEQRWAFFDSHFVSCSGASSGRKYGNAAVGHANDVKCLHALVAQSLCGVPNVIGDAVVQYILFLSNKVRMLHHASGLLDTREAANCDDRDEDRLANVKKSMDDVSALVVFAKNWALRSDVGRETVSVALDANDLCSAARDVLTFLEGKPPKCRRKRRVN